MAWALCGVATLHLPTSRDEFPNVYGPADAKKSEIILEHVLVFLDDYFETDDIDRPADKKKICYLRCSWLTVYDKYLEYCRKMRLHNFVARYDKFVCIR